MEYDLKVTIGAKNNNCSSYKVEDIRSLTLTVKTSQRENRAPSGAEYKKIY